MRYVLRIYLNCYRNVTDTLIIDYQAGAVSWGVLFDRHMPLRRKTGSRPQIGQLPQGTLCPCDKKRIRDPAVLNVNLDFCALTVDALQLHGPPVGPDKMLYDGKP